MMHPSYALTVGSRSFSPETDESLVSVEVMLNIGLPIDSAQAVFAGGKDLSLQRGDPVTVQLGYDDSLALTFSGSVEDIERGVSKVRLTALGHAARLLRLRLNRVYLNQTAGGIVRDLAQEAGVKVKKCADGIVFPTYVVDDALNAYEHTLKLAERCGFDAYTTEEGQLVFKEYTGGEAQALEFGKDIIRVEETSFAPAHAGVSVYGESPSSAKGAETFHWLTKQGVKGEAGTGAPLVVQDPAIKSREAAESVARAGLNRLQRTSWASVEIVGDAGTRLGGAVAIKGLPDSAINGEFQVRSLRHYLSKTRGFTTTIGCRRL